MLGEARSPRGDRSDGLSDPARAVSVGRVGRAHGRDGSFYVEAPDHPLEEGTEVSVAGRTRRVERRAGADDHPLVRLSGVGDPEAPIALHGESLLVSEVS